MADAGARNSTKEYPTRNTSSEAIGLRVRLPARRRGVGVEHCRVAGSRRRESERTGRAPSGCTQEGGSFAVKVILHGVVEI